MQILEFDLDGDYVELKQLLKLADGHQRRRGQDGHQ